MLAFPRNDGNAIGSNDVTETFEQELELRLLEFHIHTGQMPFECQHRIEY